MNEKNAPPAIQLTDKETLCLLMFKNVIFNSEHLKDTPSGDVADALDFLFTSDVTNRVLDLLSQNSKQEIQLVYHTFIREGLNEKNILIDNNDN